MALAMLLTAVGCRGEVEKSPVDPVMLEPYGVDGIPPFRILVPRFGASWSALPAAYRLSGGSVAEGFMTTIIVRHVGSCSSPLCERERIGEAPRSQTCTADDGTTVHVEHHIDGVAVCCVAWWTTYEPMTDERLRIASGIESACHGLERASR